MKNLFSINVNESSEFNTATELSKDFVIREVGNKIADNQKKIADKMEEMEKKWTLPPFLAYSRVVALGIGAMLLACTIMIIIGVGFAQAFSSGWFIACFVVGVLLCSLGTTAYIVESRRKKAVEQSDEYKKVMDYIEDLSKKSQTYLNIPKSKVSVDVFFYPYILKDEEMKDSGAFKYLNMSLFLFEEKGRLCLANNTTVYGIEKSLFKRMAKSPKKTSFTLWNKDVSHLREPYKDYKITLDHYGIYQVRGACSLQFVTPDEESFEIVIPPYEIEHFKKILDLKVTTQDEDEPKKK